MREEMVSMQRFDDIFSHVQQKLHLSGTYDPYNINHDCMREVISNFEGKCGRLSDYGLIYVKYFAEACQTFGPSVISSTIECWSIYGIICEFIEEKLQIFVLSQSLEWKIEKYLNMFLFERWIEILNVC